jgi:hypothetical protein
LISPLLRDELGDFLSEKPGTGTALLEPVKKVQQLLFPPGRSGDRLLCQLLRNSWLLVHSDAQAE